jgi:hypothetical protein
MKPRPVKPVTDAQIEEALTVLAQARRQLEAETDAAAPVDQQCFHWFRVRTAYEAVKKLADSYEAVSRRMSYDQLPDAFRKANLQNLTLSGIGRFSKSFRTTARVVDQAGANNFLRMHGQGDAIREMVPSATLNSIVGALLKEGIEPTGEEIVANTYAYTSFTKD